MEFCVRSTLRIGSTILLATLTTGAYAADVVSIQEPVLSSLAPAFNWSGAYIGGQIDYTMARGKYSNGSLPETKANGKGFLGGIYTGYNFDVGNDVILGTELDFAGSLNKAKAEDNLGNSARAFTNLRWAGAARARVGYAMDRFLPYIAGGVALGGIKDTLKTGNSNFTTDKTRAGWTIGGGVDYAATDNVILRLEYRYTDFGKLNVNLNNAADFSRKLTTNDIRMGIAYKF